MTTITENIQRIMDERANAWETTGKPLADIAQTRAFTAEEQGKWEAAERDFGAFSARINALSTSLEQERQIADFRHALASDVVLRTAFETELRSVLGKEANKREFDAVFTGRELKRALSAGTATAGGNTVPATFWNDLIVPLRNFATILDAGATVITTASGEDMSIPRLTTPGAAVDASEGTTIGGTDPTFDKVTLKSFKLGDYIALSRELSEDSAVDIEALVIELIGQNIGARLGSKLSVGTGTNETRGLITSATVGVTGATGVVGAPSFDNLIDLLYSVAAPYRANGKFIIADGALAGIRKLKGNDGQYLWAPAVVAGQPDLILGKAVYADPYMTTGLGAKSVAFGDVSKYWVRFVNSLRVDRSEHALFGSDSIAFRGVLRADGVLTDTSAVKVYQGAAS